MTDVRTPHQCDLCQATWTLLDGFLARTAEGLRESLTQQARAAGIVRPFKGFQDVPDVKRIQQQVDAQHVHELAAVLTWWVRVSLATFKGDLEPLETAIVNAFAENGVTDYEAALTEPTDGDHAVAPPHEHSYAMRCIVCGEPQPS
jgi:hypothetical protein